MATTFTMPSLAEGNPDGIVSGWFKDVGEHVEIGERLVDISTDKIDMEVPSPVAGVVARIVAAVGDTVPFGGVLAVIGDPLQQPGVTGLRPSEGPLAGTRVEIDGTHLTPADLPAVLFGTVPAATVEIDHTHPGHPVLAATAPHATAPGPVPVTVSTLDGTSTATVAFTYLAAPVVSAVTPPTGSPGGASVTLTGTGLRRATAVHFGEQPAVGFSATDDSTLTATAPAHAAGPVPVTVTTPGGTSSGVTFTYATVPTLAHVSPAAGPVGGGGVTLTGTGLGQATGVHFGNLAATPAGTATDTTLDVIAPAHAAGQVPVTVTTPGGTTTVTAATTYDYQPVPVLTGTQPAVGPITGGPVTLTGTGLRRATAVRFDSSVASGLTAVDDTSLRITAPARPAGTATITVTTPGGTSPGDVTFTYLAAPTLTAVAPAMRPLAGGTVTLTGTGLGKATAVHFGDAPAAGLTATGDTTLTATAPSHAAGPVPVTATTPGGTSSPVMFTYVPVPTLTAVSPAAGPAAGGPVTLTGTGLIHATTVHFGDTAVTDLTVAGDTTLTVNAPALPPGPAAVTVTSPGGTSNQAVTYTAVPAPSVTALSPATAAAGTAIFLTGAHLLPVTAVLFGANHGTDLSADNDNQLLVTVPPGTGTVTVTATSRGGTSTGVLFTYA